MGDLSAVERDALWAVFERYYAGVERAGFERDLAPKHHVILLRDAGTGALRGFSTLHVGEHIVEGRRVLSIFSGDTIVDRAYWGERALHRAFFVYVAQTKLRHPRTPVYWFLITKGYKTYLLLTRNFPEHWPRRDRATPAWQQAMIDTLSLARFGDAYDPARGVLRWADEQGRLRPSVAPIDELAMRDPDVRFFASKNPDAARGDELCCVGRVGLGLAVQFGQKQLARALGRDAR